MQYAFYENEWHKREEANTIYFSHNMYWKYESTKIFRFIQMWKVSI